MKVTASGGTDGANIVLFWPDHLPHDCDALLSDDPVALVESLRDAGKLIWFPCDGDGGYTLGVFIDCDPPEALARVCKQVETIPALTVRGVGYFGGMEYMFKDDRSLLDQYPGMCETVAIPAGTYSARVDVTDISDKLFDEWLASTVGHPTARKWRRFNTVEAAAVASVIVAVLAVFFVSWEIWAIFVFIAALLCVLAFKMSKSEWYKLASAANEEFPKHYPTYVVRLNPVAPKA